MSPFGNTYLPPDPTQVRPGGPTPTPVQSAIQFLSLRLPKVVGAQAPVSQPLLTAPGGRNVDAVTESIMRRMFGSEAAPAGTPGAAGSESRGLATAVRQLAQAFGRGTAPPTVPTPVVPPPAPIAPPRMVPSPAPVATAPLPPSAPMPAPTPVAAPVAPPRMAPPPSVVSQTPAPPPWTPGPTPPSAPWTPHTQAELDASNASRTPSMRLTPVQVETPQPVRLTPSVSFFGPAVEPPTPSIESPALVPRVTVATPAPLSDAGVDEVALLRRRQV